jgi:hypothetical protein
VTAPAAARSALAAAVTRACMPALRAASARVRERTHHAGRVVALPVGFAAAVTWAGVAGLWVAPVRLRKSWERTHHAGRAVALSAGPAAAVARAGVAGLRGAPVRSRKSWERTNDEGRALTLSAGLAAAVTRAGMAALRVAPARVREPWERTNYTGRSVSLSAGLAAAAAVTAGAARVRPAAGAAVLVAGLCGAYDDVAGYRRADPRRGFRAHLRALRDGEVTSGAVKLFGISAAALAAGARLKERPLDKLLAGVVIAGAAHAVNLLDVRPGRAAGAVLALGAPGLLRSGTGAGLAAVAMGAAAAVLPDDLGERTMLGDTGAHALGAALGTAAAAGNGRAGLLAHAAAAVAAAAYGERATGSS